MNVPGADRVRIAFWNVQNLFDIDTSSVAADLGFSPLHGWDRRGLEAKLDNLAEILRGAFCGIGPDLIGLCEIENTGLVEQLIRRLDRDDYQIAAATGSGVSAIDTALIYSEQLFDLVSSPVGHVVDLSHPTCDILEVGLRMRQTGEALTVLVNHWPTRKDDHGQSESLRIATAAHCMRLVEQRLKFRRREYLELSDSEISLQRLNDRWNSNVLVMGDFNDAPWDRSIHDILRARYSLREINDSIRFTRGHLPSYRSYAAQPVTLFNPAWRLLSHPDEGTTIDETSGRALLSDQIMVSRGLLMGTNGLRIAGDSSGIPVVDILRPDMMTDSDRRPRAFRCDNHSGYSSHFPITAEVEIYASANNPPDEMTMQLVPEITRASFARESGQSGAEPS